MRRLISARGRAIVVAATALVAGGSAAGCDTQEDADLDRGRELFVENCGTCHALTEARQTATVGPDLDASFAAARATGMDQDTIEGVVQSQIENPRTINEDNPYYDRTFMPAGLVSGQDAEDVAAYVASVAGIPGIEPPELGPPEEVFVEQCGACHTLEAANTAGTTGPVLDDVLPGQSAEEIADSITNPEGTISPGFPGGVMPEFNENVIPEENLQELVDFLMQAVGSGGGAGSP